MIVTSTVRFVTKIMVHSVLVLVTLVLTASGTFVGFCCVDPDVKARTEMELESYLTATDVPAQSTGSSAVIP